MSRNTTLKALLAIFIVILLAGGIVAVTRGGNANAGTQNGTPGHTNQPGAEITVTVRDQDQNGLSGVSVQSLDPSGNRVDSGVTNAGGEVIVNLGSAAGVYRIVAPDVPAGYINHSDSDGANNGVPQCNDPHRCIRYSVDARGTVTVTDDPTLDSGLGWIEFHKIIYRDDQDEKTYVDPDPADELIERPSGGDDTLLGGGGDSLFGGDESANFGVNDPATAEVECKVAHGQGESDIITRVSHSGGGPNTIALLGDAVLVVTGETMNNGDPMSSPFFGGSAETTSGIFSYGDHPATVQIFNADGNLLGMTEITPQVGPSNGPLEGCGGSFPLGLPPLNDNFDDSLSEDVSDDVLIGGDDVDDLLLGGGNDDLLLGADDDLPDSGPMSDESRIRDFGNDFGEAHDRRDTAFLVNSLHPAVVEAFGAEACQEHVAATTGGVTGVSIVEIGDEQSLDLGELTVDNARPVIFGWIETASGQAAEMEGWVAITEDGVRWFTPCG